ncbi:hypothetical protein A2U01_0050408, partial [Trifolium medium]|nr:hypothetical protein [Trifolium medium]
MQENRFGTAHGTGRGLAARGTMFSQTRAAAPGFCAGRGE